MCAARRLACSSSGAAAAATAALGAAAASAAAAGPRPGAGPSPGSGAGGPRASRCYFETQPDGSVDRLGRWSRRGWSRVPPGKSPSFHLKGAHPILERHLPQILSHLQNTTDEKEAARPLLALVPLCGKSYDLPFLCQQGFSVVGVEAVLRPIMEFGVEQRERVRGMKERAILSQAADGSWSDGASFEAAEGFSGSRPGRVFRLGAEGLGYYSESPAVWRGRLARRGAGGPQQLHILQADWFEVSPELVAAASAFAAAAAERGSGAAFDLAFDRGGLDSVPPGAREEYVAVLTRLLRPGGQILVVVLEYDQAQVPVDPTGSRMRPPPFSVPEAEVLRLFPAPAWTVEVLERAPEKGYASESPAFRGVKLDEVAYLITKRQEPPPGGGRPARAGARDTEASEQRRFLGGTGLAGAVVTAGLGAGMLGLAWKHSAAGGNRPA